MKLVIDISEKRYKDILRIASVEFELKHFQTAEQIIANGTPLPNGQGRLISMSGLQKVAREYTEHDTVQLILADREDYFPTIIEADRSEK